MGGAETFFDVLMRHGRAQPDKPAVHQIGGGTLTYAELAKAATCLRDRFDSLPAEVRYLPLCMARTGACVAAILAATGTGRSFVCMNQKLRPPQIVEILQALQARVVLMDAVGTLALRGWQETGLPLDKVDWWVLPGGRWTSLHDRVADGLTVSVRMDAWVPGDVPVRPPASPAVGDDMSACCLFTSGSTGAQKGVRVGRHDLVSRVEAEVEAFGITEQDVLLGVLPFSFDVGLNQMLVAMRTGATLVLSESWLPVDLLKAVAQWKVTGISGVPSIWTSLVRGGFSFDGDGEHKSLRYITVSGGDMNAADLSRLREVTGKAGIFKTYGQTEAFRSTCLQPDDFDRKPGSVGRPFADCRVYVVNDKGRPVGAGQEGQVVHTGVGTMLGYFDGDAAAGKLLPNPYHGASDPHRVAVMTGDQGRLDEEGFLYLLGRRDQMIKINGNRVYPQGIADAAAAVPGVAAAEVVTLSGPDGGTRFVAFVVLEGSSSLAASEMERMLAARLPSFMQPSVVQVIPTMPLTASGKPDRMRLAEMACTVSAGTAGGNLTKQG